MHTYFLIYINAPSLAKKYSHIMVHDALIALVGGDHIQNGWEGCFPHDLNPLTNIKTQW